MTNIFVASTVEEIVMCDREY